MSEPLDVFEIAWAGGLFEGEGTFSMQTNLRGVNRNAKTTKKAFAAVRMTDRDVLERFATALGLLGCSVTGPYTRQDAPRNKPFYSVWIGSFERVQALGAMLWPWLGERRRVQLVRVLRESTPDHRSRYGRTCRNCGRSVHAIGRCRACYVYWKRHDRILDRVFE